MSEHIVLFLYLVFALFAGTISWVVDDVVVRDQHPAFPILKGVFVGMLWPLFLFVLAACSLVWRTKEIERRAEKQRERAQRLRNFLGLDDP